MDTATCGSCGKAYAPHPAYRNKTQACDGPNGYCAGVIDGREDVADELRAAVERCAMIEAARDGWMDLHDAEVIRADKAEAELAKVTAERDEARSEAD